MSAVANELYCCILISDKISSSGMVTIARKPRLSILSNSSTNPKYFLLFKVKENESLVIFSCIIFSILEEMMGLSTFNAGIRPYLEFDPVETFI